MIMLREESADAYEHGGQIDFAAQVALVVERLRTSATVAAATAATETEAAQGHEGGEYDKCQDEDDQEAVLGEQGLPLFFDRFYCYFSIFHFKEA